MIGRKLFRGLLRALPFDFRADYGRELEQAFDAERRDAPGAAARAGVWVSNVSAILAIGPREHFNQFRQDITYALRGMRRDRGFVAVAILTLALGTGVNTAIFSMVHAVLLKPLPFADSERLVSVMNRWDGQARGGLSNPEYLDYSEQSRLMNIAAMAPASATITGGVGEPERVVAALATWNIFNVLERQPALGRGFTADEGRPGSNVVVISDSMWRQRFAADPSIAGRTVNVNGAATTIVGVLPPDFVLPIDIAAGTQADAIVPAAFDRAAPRLKRGGHYLTGVGRLEPGASIAGAAAEMNAVVGRLIAQYPEEHNQGNFAVTIRPLRDDLLGDSTPVLWILTGAVALVLLLACANVANLMLARGEVRRRELSVRSALGASRFRVARQLVTEALVLSVGATLLGLLIARSAHALILATAPAALPRMGTISLSVPVLAFAAALAMLITVLFGALPALQLSRTSASEALKDGARGGSAGTRAYVRRALVVSQVTLAVVLLVGAGLLVKTFVRVLSVPSGIDPEHVLTARIDAPASRYPGLPQVSAIFTRVLERVRTLPGVQVAGAGSGLPLAVTSGDWGFDIEGRARVNGRRPGRADWYVVTPGYFEALRIAVLAGRGPEETDSAEAPAVIFLNQSAARTMFPGQDPVGRKVRLSSSTGPEQPWRSIAGVVSDVRQRGLDQNVRPEMFIPYRQFLHFSGAQARTMTVVVRTSGEPEVLISAIRGELRQIDPEIPLASPRPMTDVLSASVASRRLNVLLIGAFAVLAIVLATVGVYGVIAYDVLQRTREIGIRVALGASRRSVLALMLLQGMKLVLIGAAVGLAGAAAITGSISPLLFEVGPRDLAVFGSVGAAIAAAGALATYVPARRATRLDPLTALRTD